MEGADDLIGAGEGKSETFCRKPYDHARQDAVQVIFWDPLAQDAGNILRQPAVEVAVETEAAIVGNPLADEVIGDEITAERSRKPKHRRRSRRLPDGARSGIPQIVGLG